MLEEFSIWLLIVIENKKFPPTWIKVEGLKNEIGLVEEPRASFTYDELSDIGRN